MKTTEMLLGGYVERPPRALRASWTDSSTRSWLEALGGLALATVAGLLVVFLPTALVVVLAGCVTAGLIHAPSWPHDPCCWWWIARLGGQPGT